MAPLPRLRRLSRLAPLALAAALLAAACGAADEAAGDGAGCEALASPVSGPAPELASASGEWPSGATVVNDVRAERRGGGLGARLW